MLEIARERTGRSAHLLEKDSWFVWAHVRPWLTQCLEQTGLSAQLTFGGRECEQLLIRCGALSEGGGYVDQRVTSQTIGLATEQPSHA